MEGAVIVLSCIIFSAFASSSTPTIDTSITTVTMIWKYIGEVIFNMRATRSQLKRLSVRDLGGEVILLQN